MEPNMITKHHIEIFHSAVDVVVRACQYVRTACHEGISTEAKENYADLVTEADQNVEKMIVEGLSQRFPNHKFIGEESVAGGAKCSLTDEPTWIIDPVDGTTNFVHRFPYYCISLALFEAKQPVIGIVYNVPLDHLYTAVRGQGAFCNGKLLRCSKTIDLKKALIITEFGNQRDPSFLQFKVDSMTQLISQCHGLRCMGSAALNICMVASGAADAYYEFGLHCWDMAAGLLIATEAGAVCSSPNGSPLNIMSRKILVCATETLAHQISSSMKDFQLEQD